MLRLYPFVGTIHRKLRDVQLVNGERNMATGYKIQAIEIKESEKQYIFIVPGYERPLSVGYVGAM